MKLYLSSYRIPTPGDLGELLQRDFAETSVAIIPNAKDYRPEREAKLAELVKDLGDIGLHNTEQVDLNDFEEPEKLRERLSSFNMLYVCGGNTTDLLFAVRASGFHQVVKSVLDQGVVFVGESAGAIIAGKTTKGFESELDPPGVIKHYTTGLSLVDKVVVPHADNPNYNDRVPYLQSMYSPEELVIIDDNQAFVVNNDEGRIVTGA